MPFDSASVFERDIRTIYADAAALPHGAPNFLDMGTVRVPCAPGGPATSLEATLAGEEGTPTATVHILSRDMPPVLDTGARVSYAGRLWRISSAEKNLDGLDYRLTLEGLRK